MTLRARFTDAASPLRAVSPVTTPIVSGMLGAPAFGSGRFLTPQQRAAITATNKQIREDADRRAAAMAKRREAFR